MPASEHMDTRIKSVDLMKGLIMVFIVFVHIFILVPKTGGGDSRDVALPLQILYLGLMMFFIFSGYFYRPGRSPAQNIRKRAVQLLVPLFIGIPILSVILYLYLTVIGADTDIGDLKYNIISIFGSVHMFEPISARTDIDYGPTWINNGFYFFHIMLVGFIIFYLVIEKVINDNRRIAATIAALVLIQILMNELVDIVLPFWLNLVPISTAFMFAGAAIAKVDLIRWAESYPLKERKYWAFFIVSIAVLIGMCMLFPPGTGYDRYSFGKNGGWSAIPYFIEACAGCYLFIILGTFLCKVKPLNMLFSAVGRHTVAVISCHIFVIKVLIAPFYELSATSTFPDMSLISGILAGLLTLVIITSAAEFLQKYLAGKHISR